MVLVGGPESSSGRALAEKWIRNRPRCITDRPQGSSPKFAPPIEFVDQATLSPPEGYKDGSGLLDNALGGALGGHVFGAQHIQQLQTSPVKLGALLPSRKHSENPSGLSTESLESS
uniref:Uncharacterized protein n=1 Tax=Anopheles atroparvus TaxID=41427 RepID=A0A182IMY5_ANOAO